jgi:hypothetical protein
MTTPDSTGVVAPDHRPGEHEPPVFAPDPGTQPLAGTDHPDEANATADHPARIGVQQQLAHRKSDGGRLARLPE